MQSGHSGGGGLLANPWPSLAQFYELAWRVRWELPKVVAPCLTVHAVEDDIASAANARIVASRVGGRAESVWLKDSYHMVTIDRQRQIVVDDDRPGGGGPSTGWMRWTAWIGGSLVAAVIGVGGWWVARGPSPEVAMRQANVRLPERAGAVAAASTVPVAPRAVRAAPRVPLVRTEEPSMIREPLARRPRRDIPRERNVPYQDVARRPSVTLEYVVGARGVSEVEVRAAILPLKEQLRRCHGEAIERGQGGDRRIIVDLTVRGTTVVAIAPRAGARSPRRWSCLRGVLLSARFGRAPAYAEASVTLRLGSP